MTEAKPSSARWVWVDSSPGWTEVFRACVSVSAGGSPSLPTWPTGASGQVVGPSSASVSTLVCVCVCADDVCVLLTGGVIPPDAVLVYDVLLLDVWNTEDKVEIRTISKPASCNRTTAASDFIRYHYNGTLLSGAAFDSRLAECCCCIR